MFSSVINRFKIKFNHFLTVRFFFSNIIIPFGVLTSYFLALSWLLPDGVNQVFMARSGKYALVVTGLLFFSIFVFIGLSGAKRPFLDRQKEQLSVKDLVLLLIPLGPVVQYILNNFELLSIGGVVLAFFVCSLFAVVFVFIIPVVLGKTGSTRTMMAAGLALTFSIFNMASLSDQYYWYEEGYLTIQLFVFGIVFIVSFFFFQFNYRNVLNIWIVIFFLANTFFQLSISDNNQSNNNLEKDDNMLLQLIGSREPVLTPNIYLLVYDAYVVNETMLAHGIDNRPQEVYLEGLDFQIYPNTYSIAPVSVETMSRVLNASVDFYGKPRQGASGDGVVQNLLNEFGYETYGVFPSNYFFRGIAPSYDYAFPNYDSNYATATDFFVESVFMGEFRFDAGFDDISREQFIAQKNIILNESSLKPRFFYMHSTFPGHSQNSGSCLPNEVELFEDRLSKANLEMVQDVDSIIENDPTAIVIVAGDHGPFLTKNCESTGTGNAYDISEISRIDIQDRFGTFLAIRWPTEDFADYDDVVVLQDIFPAVFGFVFQDPTLLEARVEPITMMPNAISGVTVEDGLIRGGIHNGEPLFIGGDR